MANPTAHDTILSYVGKHRAHSRVNPVAPEHLMHAVVDEESNTVADVYPVDAPTLAALYGAAPDLYAALQNVTTRLEIQCLGLTLTHPAAIACREARAILARARGGASRSNPLPPDTKPANKYDIYLIGGKEMLCLSEFASSGTYSGAVIEELSGDAINQLLATDLPPATRARLVELARARGEATNG